MSATSEQSGPATPPKGHPLLAWLVILAVVALVLIRLETARPASKGRLDLFLMEMQARYLIGAAELLPGSRKMLYDQARQTLDRGSYGQRLRFAVVAAELAGPATALKHLLSLRKLWAEREPPPTPEEADVTDLLERLYTHRGSQPPEPDGLTEGEQARVRKELGWLGELAVAPPGSDARKALLAPALRAAVVVPVVILLGLGVAVVGFVLLIVLATWLGQGRLHGGLGLPSGNGGIYAETFALWMLLYTGLSYALLFLPRGLGTMWLQGAIMLGSLVVLGWPVWRGIPWRQVRRDLGLHLGRGPLVEGALGVGCYATALPLLILGLLVMSGLLLLKRRLGWDGDSFGPSSNPGHPVMEVLVRGDWWLRLQVLLAASVVAPLVEETMFRGLLYRHLREATSAWRAGWSVVASAGLSSLVFAIIHPQGLLAVPALMGLALAFSLAREWRGTLLPSMVAHGINNGVVTLVLLVMAG